MIGKCNYENWLKSKTPEEQDRVLGKGKADLWRRGVITFSDMLDQSGRPLTLEQLQTVFNPNFIQPVVNTRTLKEAKFTQSQIKAKYLKHAEVFPELDSQKSNPRNWKLLQNEVINHLNDENTRQFGHYRGNVDWKVYYNDRTGIAVVFDDQQHFKTAFIPNDDIRPQLTNYLKNGVLW